MLAGGRRGSHLADALDELPAEVERRHEDLAERLRAAEARDEVEQVRDVRRDIRIGGEEPDVLVEPRRRRVVVPRPDMDVPLEAVALLADNECRLGGGLNIREPDEEVHAGMPERPDHSMLHRSSKRALSSTMQTLCLPFSAASINAGASAESWLVR
jgi:hypothetical protein